MIILRRWRSHVVSLHNLQVITSKVLRSPPWLGWPLWNICVTNYHGYVPLVVSTFRFFPHSRRITGFETRLTRRVPLVEQELLTLTEYLSSPPVLVGFVLRDLLFYMNVLSIDVCPFVLFLLVIVLSVLLRYTVSDCPFGIFKLFCDIWLFLLIHKRPYLLIIIWHTICNA